MVLFVIALYFLISSTELCYPVTLIENSPLTGVTRKFSLVSAVSWPKRYIFQVLSEANNNMGPIFQSILFFLKVNSLASEITIYEMLTLC